MSLCLVQRRETLGRASFHRPQPACFLLVMSQAASKSATPVWLM